MSRPLESVPVVDPKKFAEVLRAAIAHLSQREAAKRADISEFCLRSALTGNRHWMHERTRARLGTMLLAEHELLRSASRDNKRAFFAGKPFPRKRGFQEDNHAAILDALRRVESFAQWAVVIRKRRLRRRG